MPPTPRVPLSGRCRGGGAPRCSVRRHEFLLRGAHVVRLLGARTGVRRPQPVASPAPPRDDASTRDGALIVTAGVGVVALMRAAGHRLHRAGPRSAGRGLPGVPHPARPHRRQAQPRGAGIGRLGRSVDAAVPVGRRTRRRTASADPERRRPRRRRGRPLLGSPLPRGPLHAAPGAVPGLRTLHEREPRTGHGGRHGPVRSASGPDGVGRGGDRAPSRPVRRGSARAGSRW
jgi:hypothetical protein